MSNFLSKEECEFILKDDSDWQFYNQDFKYFQKIIDIDWLNLKLKKHLKDEKKIIVNEKIDTRLIKLSKGDKLATHSFDYSNSKSLYRNTIFTIVVFLNEDFKGGEYYFNYSETKINMGYCVIHDRSTRQSINKIKDGECYVLFSHFGKISSNKLF
jgi:predicted N-acyltransferase